MALTLGRLFPGPALVARLGGEEFCVLVSGLDRQQTLLRFNQARKAIGSTPVASGELTFNLTVSIGLATNPGPYLDDMLRRADDLIYQAKDRGRNRVVMED